MNPNTAIDPVYGPSRKLFSKIALISVVALGLMLSLSGCKATSTLTVSLGENASGTVNLALELDEEAASLVRSDAYQAKTLATVFNTEKLEKAGFKVEVEENFNGDPSKINISTRFKGQEQLQTALAVFAPEEVLNATLDSKISLINESQETSITVDLPKLRELYLDDEQVKKSLQDAGIDFSEFEALINQAFEATTLNIELKNSNESSKQIITSETSEKESVSLQTETFRTRYVLNMTGAIVSGIIGLVLLDKYRRTPALLSKGKTTSQTAEKK